MALACREKFSKAVSDVLCCTWPLFTSASRIASRIEAWPIVDVTIARDSHHLRLIVCRQRLVVGAEERNGEWFGLPNGSSPISRATQSATDELVSHNDDDDNNNNNSNNSHYNDSKFENGKAMRTEVSSIKELPGMHLLGHSCANLNGDLLFVWGGTNEEVVAYLSASSRRNASIWIYDTLTGYWRHRACSGDCPPYLSSCATCLIERKMYVFGGHSTVQDNWLNSLYCLDLETFIWRDLSPLSRAEPCKPVRSDKNLGWAFAGRMYVFGGYGWSQTEHYLELLDRQRDFHLAPDHRWPKFGWNNQLVEFEPVQAVWRWPTYSGRCPSARAAHSGALMGSQYFVFGGRDSHERLNDLYKLDMRSLHWTQVAAISEPGSVPPRGPPTRHLLQTEEEEEEEEASIEQVTVREELQDEEWNPSPSSSSNQRDLSSLAVHYEQDTYDELDDDDDDDEADSFDYPHPSHLLERWSLSSGSADLGPESVGDQCRTPEDRAARLQMDQVQNDQQSQLVAEADGGDEEQEANRRAALELAARAARDNEAELELVAATTGGRLPTGRSFCSFTPASNEDILLFGGVSSQDENLDDCWLFNIRQETWTQLNLKHKRARLWHTGSRTKYNEIVIIGGSSSDKINEYCTEVLSLSMEPKSLKRLALDAASRSIRMKAILRTKGLPPTLAKLIRLRKQAMLLTTPRAR